MKFWKYQGAGNDFVLLDQRKTSWLTRDDQAAIEHLCHRRFGIGADGLILLQEKAGYDFEMIYFNADGRESSMCGNGGRCIVAFARHLGLMGEHCHFLAIDGAHEATIRAPEDPWQECWVELKMTDVQHVEKDGNQYVLNTGSPHFVRFDEGIEQKDMVSEGRSVRYSERFQQAGINVNLVEKDANGLRIRTYERGVEDETLACGTGVTAAAIAFYVNEKNSDARFEVPVRAKGGQLSVRFEAPGNGTFSNIWLCGPAQQVFEGSLPGII